MRLLFNFEISTCTDPLVSKFKDSILVRTILISLIGWCSSVTILSSAIEVNFSGVKRHVTRLLHCER
jgi:hypothetical protein